MERSIVFTTDSYKVSHWLQFPVGTERSYYYIESRGGTDELNFFGLQAIIKKLLSTMLTKADIQRAEKFWKAHGEPFNMEGWNDLVDLGYYPLEIQAVPEGSTIRSKEVLVTITNTDDRFYWLPGWLETRLMQLWYTCTVSTKIWKCKKVIQKYLDLTGTPESIGFKLHSFGYWGVSSQESAELGAMSELVHFMGTDTVAGIFAAQEYYNTDEVVGFSIPAAEHSTITSWGKENEVDAYRNMLQKFAKPGALVAVVSDSYDIDNAVTNIWGKQLRQEVIDSGAVVVIRPDSGKPSEMVLSVVKQLDVAFGSVVNEKGYKVLNHVLVIQGDGIDGPETLEDILSVLIAGGYSADNVAFGMGGGSLQQVNRDTYKFAMKCSAVKVDDIWRDVFKSPKDAPWKASKKGQVTNKYLRIVYLNGKLLVDDDFDTVRRRANN